MSCMSPIGKIRKEKRFCFENMLKCRLLCVGKLKEHYWREACAEYEKRLRPYCRFSVTELSESRLPGSPSGAQIRQALDREAAGILSAAGGSALVALCIEGDPVSSERLADLLRTAAARGTSEIGFVIGSSYGLSERVKQKADFRLSLSALTFPHQLARVMLCEQIYRAFQINGNRKYHK